MKSKNVRLPVEAINLYRRKQEVIEKDIFNISGKKVRVPLSRIILEHAKNPLWLDKSELIKMKKWRKMRI